MRDLFGNEVCPREVRKGASRLGVCYQGSKNQIARALVNALPPGRRFVDLFAGGCAMTHAAILSKKYEAFLANDLHGFGVRLFRDAIRGKCNGAWKHWVSRKEFFEKRDTDPLVALCWSFGNNQATYLYGKDIEEMKHRQFDVRVRGNAAYRQVEALERLQSLERLAASGAGVGLDFSFLSYEEYKHRDGDVVYCDIPYRSSTETYRFMRRSGLTFDHDRFWEWARTRDYPVYVSETDAPGDFIPVWERRKRSIMKMRDVAYSARIERLFVHRTFATETKGLMTGESGKERLG